MDAEYEAKKRKQKLRLAQDCLDHDHGPDMKFEDIFDKAKFNNSKLVKQALENEQANDVMDLNEFAKKTVTADPNPDKFKCCLSQYSQKQKVVKRQYLHALPYYINEREERLKEMARLEGLKTGVHALEDDRAPVANHEAGMDPVAVSRAEKHKAEFEALYAEVRERKREHLDKMNSSELYKRKASHNTLKRDRETTMALSKSSKARATSMMRS